LQLELEILSGFVGVLDESDPRKVERRDLRGIAVHDGIHDRVSWCTKGFGLLDGESPAHGLFLLAGVIETLGGPLVMVGLFTSPVALLLSGEMAVAYFMVHAGFRFWPLLNGGEIVVANCFVFLYIAAKGSGTLSVDEWLDRTERSRLSEVSHRGFE